MPTRAHSPALSEQGFDISNSLLLGNNVEQNFSDEEDEPRFKSQQDKNSAHLIDIEDFNDEDDDESFIKSQVLASNRKASNLKGRTVKKGGGFQSMGLNGNLLKCITRKGFSVPTPIQRKTIPLIIDRQDVVGMARTGSGKTAAFVIPMIEKLKSHSVKVGARAVVLSPSRELALQTLKAVKEFGRGTDLKTILLVGGDNLETQFAEMSSNPDIIIATPGRFLHLLVEMSLDLSSVQYAVFDEADRLFEMGFATQLTEILHAMPPSRQTLLFSATLPTSLVEFAKAGLKDPQLVRLDAESKISPDLQSAFLSIKSNEKEGALLHLLADVIKMPMKENPVTNNYEENMNTRSNKRKRAPQGTNQFEIPTEHSTIVFAATKHHVEYLTMLLNSAGYAVSHVYGSLDQTARKMQVQAFREGQTTILVVTDVAARGIDIPLLANVINYDFPPQAKVFIHRVGRTARAGRSGWSYSLVQDSDLPYLLDLQLFLGRRLAIGQQFSDTNFSSDLALGTIPNIKLERNSETTSKLLDNGDLEILRGVALKGEKLYKKTRSGASSESVKRAKDVMQNRFFQTTNRIYADDTSAIQDERDRMLARISGFRPTATVFELSNTLNGAAEAMRKTKKKRQANKAAEDLANDTHGVQTTAESRGNQSFESQSESEDEMEHHSYHESASLLSDEDGEEIANAPFWQDSTNFMSYQPRLANLTEERGYEVNAGSSFASDARNATVSLTNDESRSFAEPSRMRWDKKSKKYVARANDDDGSKGSKSIRGESGQKIAASFRSGRFDNWKRAQKLGRLPRTGEIENTQVTARLGSGKRFRNVGETAPKRPDKYRDDFRKQKRRQDERKQSLAAASSGDMKNELRGVDAVRKQRALKQKRKEKNARPSKKNKRS